MNASGFKISMFNINKMWSNYDDLIYHIQHSTFYMLLEFVRASSVLSVKFTSISGGWMTRIFQAKVKIHRSDESV